MFRIRLHIETAGLLADSYSDATFSEPDSEIDFEPSDHDMEVDLSISGSGTGYCQVSCTCTSSCMCSISHDMLSQVLVLIGLKG